MDPKQLIIFENIASDRAIQVLAGADFSRPCMDEITHSLYEIMKYSEQRGFSGNLIAAYMADLIANSCNPYALAHEVKQDDPVVEGSLNDLALHDCVLLREFMDIDFECLLNDNGLSHLKCVFDYVPAGLASIYDEETRKRIETLAMLVRTTPDPAEMLAHIKGFYSHTGVGSFGLYKAFYLEEGPDGTPDAVPVKNLAQVHFSDLVGYEIPKGKLIENTEAFLSGRPANNCLLYGDAGTGKSSCIKALATEYYDRGLRIIQVPRDRFALLPDLIGSLKNRNYRFIIYMDDLSFEDFETDYKYLKAVIEGGLDERPSNVLIYATSNRRHLIKETVSDRADRDEDMHRSDTMSEKLSLSQRFGVSIYFGSPGKDVFDRIVLELARREGIIMSEDELLLEANKWELSHGGRSGRCARQFIDHLLGTV